MKAIMIMYDSLNRRFLPNYGDGLSKMPNFKRLGEHTVTFDNCYVGSLPCMPARRELHTGRLNFLHRGWCPLEPFDDSMPEILKNNGIYSHLVSDHQHYWEDGGGTYHTRYRSWECERGQEGDPWKGDLSVRASDHAAAFGPKPVNTAGRNMRCQDWVNRSYMKQMADFPQMKTFGDGIEFIEKNHGFDNWFLQIETFDPHEPFFSPEEFQELYRQDGMEVSKYDWPPYGPVTESEEFVPGVRNRYRSLLSMCDSSLGKILDLMDRYQLWEDTMLIVNTDHGYMLGEHLWWAKGVMPLYNEMANIPLFIWDPRCRKKGERRNSLVQTIDLAPTVLDYFGLEIPKDMQGFVLKDTISEDKEVRKYALFGIFGSMINITDGRYVYMRAPLTRENQPLTEYTLMPTTMRARLSPERLKKASLHAPFSFTKECPLLAVPAGEEWGETAPCYRYGDMLFDLLTDEAEEKPLDDPEKEAELATAMAALMQENDAPKEQFIRMGLPAQGRVTQELILKQREQKKSYHPVEHLKEYVWEESAEWQFEVLKNVVSPFFKESEVEMRFKDYMNETGRKQVGAEQMMEFAMRVIPEENLESGIFTMKMAARLR